MSHSTAESRTAPPKSNRLPAIRFVLGVGVFVAVVGSGVYYSLSRPAIPVDSELDEAEELSLLEATEFPPSREQPQQLPSAELNDVVTAVHQESETDDHHSSIAQVRYGVSSRPASNPAAWLDGTIEADSKSEPAPWPHSATDGSQRREFHQFSR